MLRDIAASTIAVAEVARPNVEGAAIDSSKLAVVRQGSLIAIVHPIPCTFISKLTYKC